MKPTNDVHAAHRALWEAASPRWARAADSRGIWRRCPTEPEIVLNPTELALARDLRGKRVCVLGSGDNQAVFALTGLGAQVTSVDISANQLEVARQRAHELGLAVTFVQADVTDLDALADSSFDAVYTADTWRFG